MDHDVAVRLSRSGLTKKQVEAEGKRFDALDAEGRRLYRAWLEQVSNVDIVAAVADDTPRVPPIPVHAAEPQLGYVPALTDGAEAPVAGDGTVAADGTAVES